MRDIDFEVIFAYENSNKFQRIKFWKEESVEDMVTLGPTAQATLVKNKLREWINPTLPIHTRGIKIELAKWHVIFVKRGLHPLE